MGAIAKGHASLQTAFNGNVTAFWAIEKKTGAQVKRKLENRSVEEDDFSLQPAIAASTTRDSVSDIGFR